MDSRIHKFLHSGLVLLLAVAVSGCGKQELRYTNSEGNVLFFKNDVSITFELGEEVIVNPFMGFAPDAYCADSVEQCTLAYLDITFRELEPEEGVFDFKSIEKENNLDRWRTEGKHIVFRFICDLPSDEAHMDIPDWLYRKISGDGKEYDIPYGKGFSPNYSNEIFIEYHAKAIKKLGEYFGKDNFFSYIELGSLGHWGEWHVYYEDGLPRIPPESIREKYITPYKSAFPNAKLLMRRPFKVAKENSFGLFNDMAGNPDSTQEWLDWINNGGDYNQANEQDALVPMNNAWQSAPIGGEFTSSLSMDWMLKTNITQTASMLADSHTTFLGPKCPISSGNPRIGDKLYEQGINAVIKSMGYRLGISKSVISKPKSDGTAIIELSWVNKGVAPLYFDLPVKLFILDKNNSVITSTEIEVDLSQLTHGKTIKTNTLFSLGGMKSGYKICVAIIDPMINKPAVRLINTAENIDKMMLIHQKM
ncbi:MAG: DUF4832 domain-containing protein [Oscillospiraceae bacterium]|nr:DUF4832 domain-containing protein [Oscillospiraceae bacterium]